MKKKTFPKLQFALLGFSFAAMVLMFSNCGESFLGLKATQTQDSFNIDSDNPPLPGTPLDPSSSEQTYNLEVSQSGIAQLKFNKPIEKPTPFQVDFIITASEPSFLKVVMQKPGSSLLHSMNVTLNTSDLSATLDFSEIISPITELEGNFPGEIHVATKLINLESGVESPIIEKALVLKGKPEAIKSAHESLYHALVTRNDNTMFALTSREGGIIDDCSTGNFPIPEGEVPQLISEGGQRYFGIITQSNKLLIFECANGFSLKSEMALPQGVTFTDIVASYFQLYLISSDGKLFGIFSQADQPQLTQIHQNINVKKVATVWSKPQSSLEQGLLIIDSENKLHFSGRVSEITETPLEGAFDVVGTHDRFAILFENQVQIINPNPNLDGNIETIETIDIPGMNPDSLVNRSFSARFEFRWILSDSTSSNGIPLGTMKSLFRDVIYWRVGGTEDTLMVRN